MRLTLALVAAACLCPRAGLSRSEEPAAEATRVAAKYLNHLIAGRPYAAIDECFDPASFDRRVFGADFDALPPGHAAYVAQLTSVILKTIVRSGPPELYSPRAERGPFCAFPDADKVRVTFTLSAGADTPPLAEMTSLILVRTPEWKIADIEPLAQSTAADYQKAKAQPGVTPVSFIEALAVAQIESGGRPRQVATEGQAPPARRAYRDPRARAIQDQLAMLQGQIELYKSRSPDHQYPNLAGRGWEDLLQGGYIKRPPTNPVNRRTEINEGDTGKPTSGWHWNAATGILGASYFDEQTGAVTPGAT
jgi:hypothetical protein